ncbi:uncharacterized protein LOC131037148 [Cryptomeria japonica]|uniref:uncharacterized protein LOC131037148 n=1 Tax=Cryptomeria japonica TaxID=3369 RepID=UPI0025AC537D|nr:uncharacterized protein LOC131037148 [Cryptomeria japonica]
MAGREVREYTNLSDPKDKKWGKGKDKVDDEDVAFQRMVAKMQEVAGERGGYLHGRGALDSDDLLYLKEQMEAEEDAERLRRRTEKRAFAAFKRAASLADSSPSIQPLRVEPKPKSGIRQQVLLKNILEVKPKRQRVSGHPSVTTSGGKSPEAPNGSSAFSCVKSNGISSAETIVVPKVNSDGNNQGSDSSQQGNPKEQASGGLLGLAYESSDED